MGVKANVKFQENEESNWLTAEQDAATTPGYYRDLPWIEFTRLKGGGDEER
jgi:hypothetical protein